MQRWPGRLIIELYEENIVVVFVRRKSVFSCNERLIQYNFLPKENEMIGELDPVEGNWYHNLGKKQNFMVVDVNEAGGTVDIQYFDGDIEELEIEEWEEMDLEESEPPEDWTGPLDKLEKDDRGYE
jgi:hypothetical protein